MNVCATQNNSCTSSQRLIIIMYRTGLFVCYTTDNKNNDFLRPEKKNFKVKKNPGNCAMQIQITVPVFESSWSNIRIICFLEFAFEKLIDYLSDKWNMLRVKVIDALGGLGKKWSF